MIIEIPSVLDADQLVTMQTHFKNATFQDGKLSAGPAAEKVKHNQELNTEVDQYAEMLEITQSALAKNAILDQSIKPVASTLPIFARYTQGMSYGEHLDIATTNFTPSPFSPIFPGRFRSDVSATIFLSEPDEYEGGELVIQTPAGIRGVKCAAGNMVTYPSGYVHSISEVTSGKRDVIVLWFQSFYRDPEQRHLLYQLMLAADRLMGCYPDDADVKTINYVYNNLVRQWGDSG